MSFVLGLSGGAGAGKDTVADYLMAKHGWTKKLSFARNLKDMCKAIFYLTEEQVSERDAKARKFNSPMVFTDRNLGSVLYWMTLTHRNSNIQGESFRKVKSLVGTKMDNPRKVLQLIGTEVCRTLIPSYHLDCLRKQIDDQPEGLFIVTDARFPNEGDFILDEVGGFMALVERPKLPDAENIDRTHPSETAMLNWGRFSDKLNNDREGLHFFYEEIDNFVRRNNLCQKGTPSKGAVMENSSPTAAEETPKDTGTTPTTP